MSQGSGTNIFEDALNVVTQVATVGLVGYDQKGFKGGVTVDATKEVTGATAAEEANKLARQQYEEQKAALEEQRQNKILQDKNNQIAASNASTSNKGSSSTSATGVVNTYNNPGQTDFLGL